MHRNAREFRRLNITQRTALWSWVITLLTLSIFAAAILPQQIQFLRQNLESTALRIATSLRDHTASAAINLDFASIVDHCNQMIRGDPAIDYLVISRNDGFSIIAERHRWRNEPSLPAKATPSTRLPTSSLGPSPILDQRAFHFSLPFDDSGIEWGWIHVGLSLKTYDRNVTSIYQRTGLIAVVCILIGFFASSFYARRLVQPILDLHRVVRQVADGDLTVRAHVERSDEIGTLGHSVNRMTVALTRRDRILQAVRRAAELFLAATDWRTVIQEVLKDLGTATQANRAYVFQNHFHPDGSLTGCQVFEWCGPGIHPQLDNPDLQHIDYQAAGFQRWIDLFQQDAIVTGSVSSFPASEQAALVPQGILSLIAIPIRVDGQFWGFVGLDDCHANRVWSTADRDSLRAAVEMLGSAIARQHTQEALVQAKLTLEDRVRRRTHELEEQVAAKEKARADLAEIQTSLVEASRLAGKAEVATSVLHNVGNVLNSVGVSATLICDRLRISKAPNLCRAIDLLNQHRHQPGEFLTHDPKGKVLPDYLAAVADQIRQEHAGMLSELQELNQNIEHIKKIVAMQQTHAKVSGTSETVDPAELMEDAIRININSFNRHHITVLRHYEPNLPTLNLDRHKTLQILVNLLRNARQALTDSPASPRELYLYIHTQTPHHVSFVVRDNGVGIDPDNLTSIFRHGFTTKKEGHGFGLHSSANAAREMHGRLFAHSAGPGTGAEFTLELPFASLPLPPPPPSP